MEPGGGGGLVVPADWLGPHPHRVHLLVGTGQWPLSVAEGPLQAAEVIPR